jgi:hypothetical protein
MLDVLDKVIHHEMNIFNLIFDVLKKHGEQQMMLRLYQKLLQLKINPSTFIYDIISNILDKKQIKNLFDEMIKNSAKNLKFKDYSKKNNRERTFLSLNDDLPLETKPKFYYDYLCISCNEKINLYSTCKNFEGIRNDILWVKCGHCGEYNLPKITVKFGLDFITNQSKSTATEGFVLHSPYNLKINIKNAVVTHYGTDINISNFKAQFQPLFWNFIWYCIIHNLDYNILLPYTKTLEQLKETSFYNPNRDIFEISYDDMLFKENQKKIERISNSIVKSVSGNESTKKNKFEILEQISKVITVALNCNEQIKRNSVEYKEEKEEKKENKAKRHLNSCMNLEAQVELIDHLVNEEEEEDDKSNSNSDEEEVDKKIQENKEN